MKRQVGERMVAALEAINDMPNFLLRETAFNIAQGYLAERLRMKKEIAKLTEGKGLPGYGIGPRLSVEDVVEAFEDGFKCANLRQKAVAA